MTSAVCFILFFVFLALGIPIAFAIGLATVAALLTVGGTPLQVITITMFQGLNGFLMLAVPLFLLVGRIMEIGGSSRRIFDFANSFVGWAPGGLGSANVVASMIFGGISGSSVADAGSLGRIATIEMEKAGFPKDYAAALSVSASTLAVVIPPSILMVLYAVSANVSVGQVLAAGLVPGIFIGVVLMVVNYYMAVIHKWDTVTEFSFRNIYLTFKEGVLALITPIILLGGIFSGLFTATEGAAIAVLYCIVISVFVYKDVGRKQVWQAIKESARDASAIMFLLAGSTLMSYILTVEQVPQTIATLVVEHSVNSVVTMGVVIVLLLIAGMFFDPSPAILILVPIFLPIALKLGYDPIHFGVIFVCTIAIGLITPPVAPCLMAICKVTDLPMELVAKKSLPFIGGLIFAVVIIVIFPSISLYVPSVFFGN